MGWCGGGTRIFDQIVGELLDSEETLHSTEKVLELLVIALNDEDWDCQYDTDYIDDPLVRKVYTKVMGYEFEDDEID